MSSDPKIVGSFYSQIETMVDGYNYAAKDSIYNWRESNLPPNLSCFLVNDKAILTDNMNRSLLGDSYGILVSNRVKRLVESVRSSKYQSYNAQLKYKNELYSYNYLSFKQDDLIDHVDLGKSLFVYEKFNANWDLEVYSDVDIENFDDYMFTRKNLPDHVDAFNLKYLKLNSDLDIFCLPYLYEIICSENFRDKCNQIGVTGFDFIKNEVIRI